MTTTPDHTDSLAPGQLAIAKGLRDAWHRLEGGEGESPDEPDVGDLHIAWDLVTHTLDDPSVLIQIPKVRELVELMVVALSGDMSYEQILCRNAWLTALEADQ